MSVPPFARAEHALCVGKSLRPLALPAEAAAIASMLAVQDPWRHLGYGEDMLARYLLRADPGLHRFVVRVAEARAGVVCIRHPWLRGPYIELIGFAPAAQGHGLGAAIVDWMEAQVGRDGGNLWAFVSGTNVRARRFYARNGFVEVAPVADLVAEGATEILLRKRLDHPPASAHEFGGSDG